MTVEPVHVDHSIPAAYGFIIHTSDATIAYTGDFRLHGKRRDLSEEFVQKAKECHPDALICEGTRMALQERRQNFSEQQVEDACGEIVASTDRIVFATHYSRDIDRLRSVYNAAVKNSRKLIISPKSAYLLSKLINDEHLDVPDPLKDKSVRVYYSGKRRASTTKAITMCGRGSSWTRWSMRILFAKTRKSWSWTWTFTSSASSST